MGHDHRIDDLSYPLVDQDAETGKWDSHIRSTDQHAVASPTTRTHGLVETLNQ